MKARLFILLFFAVITGMLSCKDKDLPPPVGTTTRLNVFNATADTIKFFINGTRQNNLSDLFTGGATGYLTVPSGMQNYKFSKTTNGSPTLFTNTYALDTAKYYSIFICGETADKAFKTTDPIDSVVTAIKGDTTTATANNSFVRFVNTLPGTNQLTVTVGSGDTVNFINCVFSSVSNFKPFISGLKKVKVYLNGSNTPEIDTAITFFSIRGYTLFTHGQLNGKGGNAFSVSAITNVQ